MVISISAKILAEYSFYAGIKMGQSLDHGRMFDEVILQETGRSAEHRVQGQSPGKLFDFNVKTDLLWCNCGHRQKGKILLCRNSCNCIKTCMSVR